MIIVKTTAKNTIIADFFKLILSELSIEVNFSLKIYLEINKIITATAKFNNPKENVLFKKEFSKKLTTK